jgi:hypothetical protein
MLQENPRSHSRQDAGATSACQQFHSQMTIAFPIVAVQENAFMPATGEIIRLMNYVDDIATTLRRIIASLPSLTDEEKKQLAEYMRKSDPNYIKVLESIEHPKHG